MSSNLMPTIGFIASSHTGLCNEPSCEKHCLFLGVENSLRGSILELISEKELASLNSVIPKLLTESEIVGTVRGLAGHARIGDGEVALVPSI